MGGARNLKPSAPVSQNLRDLKELQIATVALITARTRLLNQPETPTLATSKRHTTASAHHIVCSIPGIGAITAAAVLIEMPEIGTMARKQVASRAGLAPKTRQSGQWKGTAFIQGGREYLRDALSMPARVAMRFNPDLRAICDKFRGAEKPAKVALTACIVKTVPQTVF